MTFGVPELRTPVREDGAVPKIVNRESRRSEIVEAYLRVVARDGIEQATSRTVAVELGVSSGALWHWFRDFDEVLSGAFRTIFERTNRRIAEQVGERRGIPALVAMLGEVFPLTKVTSDEALVVVSFWGRVPSHPGLGGFQKESEEAWRRALVGHLAEAQDAGHLRVEAPLAALADVLLVLANGQQVEHVLHTTVAEPARQWELVTVCLVPWLTDEGRRSGALPGPDAVAARG